MRFASKKHRGEKRLVMNMTSLIDVTFLLLVYFMVSTVMARQEDQLTSSLQTRDSDATGSQVDFQPQIIEVLSLEGTPSYRLAGRVFTDDRSLESVLSELPHEIGVFVRVHPNVPVGFALAAVQSARNAGFTQVTYVPEK